MRIISDVWQCNANILLKWFYFVTTKLFYCFPNSKLTIILNKIDPNNRGQRNKSLSVKMRRMFVLEKTKENILAKTKAGKHQMWDFPQECTLHASSTFFKYRKKSFPFNVDSFLFCVIYSNCQKKY